MAFSQARREFSLALVQNHRRHAILAGAHGLTVGFKRRRDAVHETEHAASTGGDVSNCRRAQSALRRDSDSHLGRFEWRRGAH